jgi:hypothetical protein
LDDELHHKRAEDRQGHSTGAMQGPPMMALNRDGYTGLVLALTDPAGQELARIDWQEAVARLAEPHGTDAFAYAYAHSLLRTAFPEVDNARFDALSTQQKGGNGA